MSDRNNSQICTRKIETETKIAKLKKFFDIDLIKEIFQTFKQQFHEFRNNNDRYYYEPGLYQN